MSRLDNTKQLIIPNVNRINNFFLNIWPPYISRRGSVLDISLTQYYKDRRVFLMPNGGSSASTYKPCTGDVRNAPKHNRKP